MTLDIAKSEVSPKRQHDDVVLAVRGVSKKFCRDLKRSLFYGVQDIASELIGFRQGSRGLRFQEFWALKDVSFELRRGEALGLIGKNGSGKTTLLRIIAGLIKPDTGSVEIEGRIAPLIALGAGFNPILTGRENVYANMSILGLSRREIDEQFEAVIEFAEIGDAIDAPVQSYSSGMAARLGFASAIHTEPDILLIDEVLAVGDVKFRAKCHRKLHELLEQGTSFVLVSHMAHAVMNVCQSAVYLRQGHLVASGTTDAVMNQYEEDLFSTRQEKSLGAIYLPEKSAAESLGLDITALFFRDEQENILELPVTGLPTYFCVECKADQNFDDVSIYLVVREIAGENNLVLHLSSFFDENSLQISPGKQEIRVYFPYLGLKPGFYNLRVLLKQGSIYTFDVVESFRFEVKKQEKIERGLFYQPRVWQVVK